jgi:hypothetical protein
MKADAAIEKVAAQHFNQLMYETVTIRGSNHDAEEARVAHQLEQLSHKRLSRAEEQAERERLWAEEDRLNSLPDTPDEVIESATGESYATRWQRIPRNDRGRWLKSEAIEIAATKTGLTVSLPWEPEPVTVAL